MKKISLIKIGGSLITDKTKAYTPKLDVIKNIASQIQLFLITNPDHLLVIATGGGSFPHTSATKYKTSEGFTTLEGKYGFCVVMHDAARINRLVIHEFLNSGINCVSLQPSSMFISKNNNSFFTNFINLESFLEMGIIPILYGDAILDITKGSTIYSADKCIDLTAEYLIKLGKYKIEKILSIGDYEGVLDTNNKIIEKITRKNYDEIKKNFYDSKKIDVTGGMQTKVLELLNIADIGLKSQIINGNVSERIFKALNNEKVPGTIIE